MSQGYVPGPAQNYLGIGGGGAMTFLGYSENGVSVRLIAAFRDIVSDFGGPDIPVDVQFMGEHGYFSMTLNKYSEPALQTAAGRRLGGSVVTGAIEANALGSLMIGMQYAYPSLVYAAYAQLGFNTGGNMVSGYQFSATWLHDEFETPVSVELKRPRCVFRAIPFWNSTTLTATLYVNSNFTSHTPS